ncbi:MAG: hypothetical protein HZA34_00110 [Candidatus Pacebacteria bacterium]|nr:hypothetical protein [Candidatus Paceibacterota bacterium]
MRYFVCVVFFFIFFYASSRLLAFTIASDPQYLVMNFSEINELNWAAPEPQWQTEIKPKILDQLHQLQRTLPPGTSQRKLAWSTLQEYMNVPLDIPSETSSYVIKMRRILEIAEQENLPVFLPLNGFQWWDELPELYNWWDPDGTHTPIVFFTRQRTPDFKDRFIRGYNPENKWNVEWQSPTQPMTLNWRNWGGGGFRLAPPPNLFPHSRTALTYRKVQKERFIALITELSSIINRWEKEGRGDLFAGITIGTEVSLNASVTPKDEFEPYGFRSTQDLLCSKDKPTCAIPPAQLSQARQKIVYRYLQDLARTATLLGIPKQRIYTHVWGEVKQGEPKFENYAQSAFNPYARPGMSFYGYAEDPFSLPVWKNEMEQHGNPSWGAVEYSAEKTERVWQKGLTNIFNPPSTPPAKIVTIYNWTEHKDTPAIKAIATILQDYTPPTQCSIPEILPETQNYSITQTFSWNYFPTESLVRFSPTLEFITSPGLFPIPQESNVKELDVLSKNTTMFDIKPGVYTISLKLTGCGGKRVSISEPRTIVIPVQLPQNDTPAWVRFILEHNAT